MAGNRVPVEHVRELTIGHVYQTDIDGKFGEPFYVLDAPRVERGVTVITFKPVFGGIFNLGESQPVGSMNLNGLTGRRDVRNPRASTYHRLHDKRMNSEMITSLAEARRK